MKRTRLTPIKAQKLEACVFKASEDLPFFAFACMTHSYGTEKRMLLWKKPGQRCANTPKPCRNDFP